MDAHAKMMRALQNGMPRRTMGTETEYTTRISESLEDAVDDRYVAHVNRADEVWTKNGGRMYIDFGTVVEYATPECTSGDQVLLHERIGQMVVRGLGDVMPPSGDVKSLKDSSDNNDDQPKAERHWPVYKRTGYGLVVNHHIRKSFPGKTSEKTTGHHETFQTGLDKSESSYFRPFLEAYLATRIVWTGAGMVGPTQYLLSQKADAINFQGTSHTAHGHKRPMSNKGSGLLEIRTGEGSMSDWVIRNKANMTSLVLRLMEHQHVPFNDIIRPGYTNAAFRSTSHNPLTPLPTNGPRIDAIDLQARIAEHALAFGEKHGAPKHEIKAAGEVLKACEDLNGYFLGHNDLSVLSDRIDWAAKLAKMRTRGIELGKLTTANLVAIAHDLSWEDTSPHGAAERWYRRRQPATFSEQELRRNASIPPSTLAQQRVDMIKEYGKRITHVDWGCIILDDHTGISIG